MAGGGACVAGGGGVSVVVGGGACVVSPSPAGGGTSVGQLPLASGVEPSGHDCAYEDCSIDNDDGDDDCTVRIAAAVTRIILIIIDTFLYIVLSNPNAFL